MSDPVNHPSHYNYGRIEVIEFIEDQKFDYNIGNAIKYISRAGRKGDAVTDLAKAIWYLNREIELMDARAKGHEPLRPNEMTNPLADRKIFDRAMKDDSLDEQPKDSSDEERRYGPRNGVLRR